MHLETLYDGEKGRDTDRLVLSSQKEEFTAEHIFMIGAGVNCGRIARDYSDPLQAPGKEYPITFSADSTTTFFRGLDKILDGPEAGYHGTRPADARKIYEILTGMVSDLTLNSMRRFFAETSTGE